MTEYIQVTTTVSSKKEGVQLAHLLVDQKLVACGQVSGPIVSVYRWQGVLEEAIEFRLTMKSRRSLFAKLVKTIEAHHSYDLPELISTTITGCSEKYEQWLDGELVDGG